MHNSRSGGRSARLPHHGQGEVFKGTRKWTAHGGEEFSGSQVIRVPAGQFMARASSQALRISVAPGIQEKDGHTLECNDSSVHQTSRRDRIQKDFFSCCRLNKLWKTLQSRNERSIFLSANIHNWASRVLSGSIQGSITRRIGQFDEEGYPMGRIVWDLRTNEEVLAITIPRADPANGEDPTPAG